MGRPPCPSAFMCRPRVQDLCLERFSGHGRSRVALAITNGAAALQLCSTQPCAVLYQTMIPGGHGCAPQLACMRRCVRVDHVLSSLCPLAPIAGDWGMIPERRARLCYCSPRPCPWTSRVTSSRPPQAPRDIFYLVVEAVHRRPHGACATHGCSRSPAAWRRRGAAQEQPWGARQRLAGWRRAWQTYVADLPGRRQFEGPCAAALSASDNPFHNMICGVVVVRFWSRLGSVVSQ